MNNQTIINKKKQRQIPYQQQRNRYRSNDRTHLSPNINKSNNDINNIRIIRNKNNNYYINQKSNNSSNNLNILKQFKAKQQNQIYLEGDLNNFINNPNNINIYSNINKLNNNNIMNNMNNININNQNNIKDINKNINNINKIQRIPNAERIKMNRGVPKKSPIPVPKGFMTGKYLNNDNMSKYSTNSNNASSHTANSQLINNNYSISNLSQISGYSNKSYNNNQINIGSIINNGHMRSISNNPSMKQKRINSKNAYNNANLVMNNKSPVPDNIVNSQKKISNYTHKVKSNNYINHNNNIKNYTTSKKPKYISKSPSLQHVDYLAYTIRKNNNNRMNQRLYNNNYINSNAVNMNNLYNENWTDKIGYKTTNNFSFINNSHLNAYKNYNFNNNQNDINYNGRPLSLNSHINKSIKRNKKSINNIITNQFSLNPNDININNYNSNEQNKRQNIFINNQNNKINNYIYEYNTHAIKRDYSANHLNNRMNFDKISNDYVNNLNNNLNNINPMVNLHIINKGQIINNNYNNINNINNNNLNNPMNNLYVYKYDISQNNIIQGKYNTNNKEMINNSKKKNKNKNGLRNNINNANIMNDYSNEEFNINYNKINNINNINKERQNIHKFYKKGIKVRNNSSSGIGVTGELNNVLNNRNNEKNNQNKINSKKIEINKINNINNFSNIYNNNKTKSINKNIQNMMNQNIMQITKPIRKIHHFTHVGFNGERDKEFNQDIAFLEKNFAGNNSYLYMAVCDGHGIEGHEVSGFIKRILPKELSNSLYNKDILTNDKNAKKKIYNTIGETFIKVNEKLINNESINSIFSGTTCVSVIYTPIRLICANIGDSRAVIGKYDKNLKKWIAVNLSRDHKPTEEDEARRIYKKGGRIKPFIDEETGEEVGPQRVWVKDDEVPGLAMTRSFGDRVAAIAGTICLPEIKEYNFTENDKFLILASDGIWEFIQSEECINIIGKFYNSNNIEGCCEFLYNESKKRWIREEEVVDDITMLLVFFD